MFHLKDARVSQQRDVQPNPRANNAKVATSNNNIDNIKIGGGSKNYNTSEFERAFI